MSSVGCARRSSIELLKYSCSLICAANDTSLIMPTPGSMWNVWSNHTRSCSRSSFGMPNREAMTMPGSSAEKSST